MKPLRILLAFILAPLAAPVLFLLESLLIHRWLPNAWTEGWTIVFMHFYLVTPVAYIGAIVFGIPTWFLLRRKGWTGGIAFGMAGGCIGLVMVLMIKITWPAMIGLWSAYPLSAILGALCAVVLRQILVWSPNHTLQRPVSR